LIAGRHRFEAAKSLGWKTIKAELIDGSARERRLMEIDENLARVDLSSAECAAHQWERKRLYEEKRPETKHGGAPGAGRGKGKKPLQSGHGDPSAERYSADAAKKKGKSESTVRREAARGAAIPDVAKLAGTLISARWRSLNR
jgi:ParB-like chromosome segregation protein Spo0J